MALRKLTLGIIGPFALLSCSSASSGREFFVDFDTGSDASAGTAAAPWKHAPGDSAATGQPASTRLGPGDTVRFKGGVSYRGTIGVAASGSPDMPITFTGSGFGDGKAIIDGGNAATSAVRCASAEQCGGFTNWQDLVLLRLPPSKLKSIQLYKDDDLLFEAQWPAPRDPFYADNVQEWQTTPATDRERIETGRLRAPETAKALRQDVRSSVLLWVRGNEFKRFAISAVEGDDLIFDPAGAKLFGNGPGRYAIVGNIGKPLPPDRFVVLADGSAVVHGAADRKYSVGADRSGFVLNGASNIVIKGFDFRRQTSDAGTWDQSIAIANLRLPASNLRITGNSFGPSFIRSGQGVVQLMRVADGVIDDNDFLRIVEGSGVRVWQNSVNISVTNNRFDRLGRTAIGFLGVEKGIVAGNHIVNIEGIHGNAISIYLNNRSIVIKNNFVFNATRPATFSGDRARTAPGDHNIVFDRNFFVSTNGGLGAVSSWGAQTRGVAITHNFFAAPKAGAWLNAEDQRVTVADNVFTGMIIVKGPAGADWQIGANKDITWGAARVRTPEQACGLIGLARGTDFGAGRC